MNSNWQLTDDILVNDTRVLENKTKKKSSSFAGYDFPCIFFLFLSCETDLNAAVKCKNVNFQRRRSIVPMSLFCFVLFFVFCFCFLFCFVLFCLFQKISGSSVPDFLVAM